MATTWRKQTDKDQAWLPRGNGADGMDRVLETDAAQSGKVVRAVCSAILGERLQLDQITEVRHLLWHATSLLRV